MTLPADSVAAVVAEYISSVTGIKSVKGFVADYEVLLTSEIAGFFNGDLTIRSVRATWQKAIRRYAKDTYIEGITDGGGEESDYDDEDDAIVNAWIAEQLAFVDDFVSAVNDAGKAEDRTAAQRGILTRVGYWVDALADLGGRGKLRAQEGAPAYWELGDTEVHCDDCLRYSKMKPRRVRQWLNDGALPRSHDLQCLGFNCDCSIRHAKTGRVLFPVAS